MASDKKKILVVEDNLMNKTLVHDILTMNGYDVIEAERGTEAIKMVADHEPDLILMDINLPGMDGVTAARLIKGSTKGADIPMLALTASAMKGDEQDLLDKGFDGYVAKPIVMKHLIKSVGEALGLEPKD